MTLRTFILVLRPNEIDTVCHICINIESSNLSKNMKLCKYCVQLFYLPILILSGNLPISILS